FAVPAGVRAGDEREIALDLAESPLRRYPGAEVHYRRNYYAPTGAGNAPASSTPAVISSDDPDRPRLQRRPAVTPVPDGSHEGPLITGGAPAAAPAPAAQQRPAAPPPAAPADPNAPGWRKARPDE